MKQMFGIQVAWAYSALLIEGPSGYYLWHMACHDCSDIRHTSCHDCRDIRHTACHDCSDMTQRHV